MARGVARVVERLPVVVYNELYGLTRPLARRKPYLHHNPGINREAADHPVASKPRIGPPAEVADAYRYCGRNSALIHGYSSRLNGMHDTTRHRPIAYVGAVSAHRSAYSLMTGASRFDLRRGTSGRPNNTNANEMTTNQSASR